MLRHQPGWHRGQPLLVPENEIGAVYYLEVLFLLAENVGQYNGHGDVSTGSSSVTPAFLEKRVLCSTLQEHVGETVELAGWLHRVRKVGRKLAFWIIRDRSGYAQVVISGEEAAVAPPLESVVVAKGEVVKSNNLAGVELQSAAISVLTEAKELPFEINQDILSAGLEIQLDHRVLSLRHQQCQAIFKVKAAICQAFRQYLDGIGFLEIQTPKIVATGTEGGAELFPVCYFEQQAFLAQSPQFYKQMMVAAGFERVYEVGPVFRAEQHNTSRHTNEFISLDVEMGFIEDEHALMDLETDLLRHIFAFLAEHCASELSLLGASLPTFAELPRISLADAQRVLQDVYGKGSPEGNLDPQGERLLCEYAEQQYGVPVIFVTAYPTNHRPFYAMPAQSNPCLTRSFDLLFKGLEVTTGGLRIHQLDKLRHAMQERELNPENYAFYLEAFEFGAPPHGGFAIGLERLTARILGLDNLRLATLFPRDRTRLVP